MKTNVSHTSVQSYHLDIKGDKEPNQSEKIYKYLLQEGGKTANELSKHFFLPSSTISARLNALRKERKAEPNGLTRVDVYSGKKNMIWVAKS